MCKRALLKLHYHHYSGIFFRMCPALKSFDCSCNSNPITAPMMLVEQFVCEKHIVEYIYGVEESTAQKQSRGKSHR